MDLLHHATVDWHWFKPGFTRQNNLAGTAVLSNGARTLGIQKVEGEHKTALTDEEIKEVSAEIDRDRQIWLGIPTSFLSWFARAAIAGIPDAQARRFVNHARALVHQIYQRISAADLAPIFGAFHQPSLAVHFGPAHAANSCNGPGLS